MKPRKVSRKNLEAIRAVANELRACRRDPARFNETILGRETVWEGGSIGYWPRQREICRSVVRYTETLVPAGNGVGKSFVAAGIMLWFLACHRGARIIATAPSQTQLEEVLWKEVERAYHGSRIPFEGRILKAPLKVDMGEGWDILAYSTTKTERISGHHREDLLFVGDEASGIPAPIMEAANSLNPSRSLLIGNPLRPDGDFYERCQKAEAQAEDEERLSNLIRIPSLESPDIHLERSPRGMADATWLRKCRNDYGEGGLWWRPHVLAQFPDAAIESLLSRAWLDAAGRAKHKRAGPTRMALDIAGGEDGDAAGILVRDDNGILYWDVNPGWNVEELARRAVLAAEKYGVAPSRITYDQGGLGLDFANRLNAVNLRDAVGYKGGMSGGASFANLRTAAAWVMRQRLDPNHRIVGAGGASLPQLPFAIPADFLARGRRELQGLKYKLLNENVVALEPKEDLKRALGGSPTLADLLIMSFAFPSA